MPLRSLLRHLLNNEHLTQKIADSYPIRRAAQLTAYLFHRGKDLGEEGLEKARESHLARRMQEEARTASKFTSSFTKELKEGFKEMNEKMKKDR